MKKITTIFAVLIMTASVFAQAPEKMSYQAVVRDGSNALVTSTAVGMQISILQGSASGTAVYVETQTPTSNANGLVSIEIGAGTVVSGDFTTIDWANGPYFIKTETDPAGGTSYTITGTSQLLSVPYALYAKSAGSISGVTGITITSVSSTADTLYLSNGQTFVTNNGGSGNLVLPTITTNTVTGITSNSATFGGAISNVNGNQIVERGIVYSTSPNPTIQSSKIVIGSGSGTFDTITSMNFQYPHFLSPNSQYYVRVYAVTENNISAYGNEVNFTTLGLTPPTITTAITDITSNSATFGGEISNGNGNKIMERGIVYSTSPNPTFQSSKIVIGNGIGAFDTVSSLGYEYVHLLNPNTNYYVCAYAVAENNTITYGNEVSFTTLSIGQPGPGGGIVFFDKGNTTGGWQYLEAAPSDQSTGMSWGCHGTSIPGTQLTVGSGEANTSLIKLGCTGQSAAAELCADLSLGGQSDWFLPSRDELNLMYKNLHLNNQGGFSTSYSYWSSTEYNSDCAWFLRFTNGFASYCSSYTILWGIRYSGKQVNYYSVRAVRAF
jgi:hypothetical protein